MESALVFAQTVFYSVFSLIAIIGGVLLIIIIYYLFSFIKNLREISKNFRNASEKTGEKIKEVIDALSKIPFLSSFLGRKNHRKTSNNKGTKIN